MATFRREIHFAGSLVFNRVKYDTDAMSPLVQEPWDLGLVYVPGAGLVPDHCISMPTGNRHEGYHHV